MKLRILMGPKKGFHLWHEIEWQNYLSNDNFLYDDFGDWESFSEVLDTICVNLENNIYGNNFPILQQIGKGGYCGWYYNELNKLINELEKIIYSFKTYSNKKQIKRGSENENNLEYYSDTELEEKQYNNFSNLYEINKYYLDKLYKHAVTAQNQKKGLLIISTELKYTEAGYLTLPELKNNFNEKLNTLQPLYKIEKQFHSGANWFYWIAGLSLVNSIIMRFKGGWNFLAGLGITQIIDGLSLEAALIPNNVSLIINIIISALFAVIGFFANKRKKWAFILGMILYLLDGLIFLIGFLWLNIGFHVFALICIIFGFRALLKLNNRTKISNGMINQANLKVNS